MITECSEVRICAGHVLQHAVGRCAGLLRTEDHHLVILLSQSLQAPDPSCLTKKNKVVDNGCRIIINEAECREPFTLGMTSCRLFFFIREKKTN